MGERTERLGLPLIAAGQSQKEITHNEALLLVDSLMQPVIMTSPLAVPPSSPVPGQCWIVAGGAAGDWLGQDHALAQWTSAGWVFTPAFNGMAAWCASPARLVRFIGGAWTDALDSGSIRIAGKQVVGAQQAPIAAPSGGTTQDAQARVAIGAILTTLRAHGLISN